jgi:adiponectin receptor
VVVVLFPRFRTPAWRPFRAFMFVAMGLSALFPVLHGIATFGAAHMERQMSLSWLFTQGALYILGAGIYAVSGSYPFLPVTIDYQDVRGRFSVYVGLTLCSQARIPERLAPGSFDIWGSSHQIFHVLVVMAAGAHLVGLLKAFDYAHSSRSSVG